MYEKYIKPEVSIAYFEEEDVIVTSGFYDDESSMGAGGDDFGFQLNQIPKPLRKTNPNA